MYYSHFFTNQKDIEIKEDVLKGSSSISPTLVFLHEVIFSYLKELSFYLINLQELGITNDKIRKHIMSILAGIFINVEYTPEQFSSIIMQVYMELQEAKKLYVSIAEKHNIKGKFCKANVKNPQKISYTEAIRHGQKYFNQKFEKFTPEQMQTFLFALNILKSICIHLVELEEIGFEDKGSFNAILKLLSLENLYNTFFPAIQQMINDFVELDHELLLKLAEYKEKMYGKMEPTVVSTSTRINKAILFSGTNLYEFELLLEATKDKNIDIYTHGFMIMAHTYPKFKKYSNLAGHWGRGVESYMIDFAQFPGPIFTSKLSFLKLESLYSSSVFTADEVSPKGVMRIKENNFNQLIESAWSSKGFTKNIEKAPIIINYDEAKIVNKFKEIKQKIDNKEIKHIFFIGTSDNSKTQKEYFERFLDLLPEDSFAVSLSYTNNKENVYLVEFDSSFILLYKLLEILSPNNDFSIIKPIILVNRCEVHTVSNIIYLKSLGINKIYFSECLSGLINPNLIRALIEVLDLKQYKDPESDLAEMLK